MRNARLWHALLGVEKTVVEAIGFVEDEQVLIARVRPSRGASRRCGVCRRRCGRYYDAFIPLAVAAQWAPELRLGTAIVPAYTRGAYTLASTVASMCQAAPGRFALGIGTSSDVIVERWNGMKFDKPYQRVRDTIRFLRVALTGEKVDEEYETFNVTGSGSGSRFRNNRRSSSPRCARACYAGGTRGRRCDHQLAVGRRREDGRTARGCRQGDGGAHLRAPGRRRRARPVGRQARRSRRT